MFENLGNITKIIKSAKSLQENLGKLQSDMAARRFDGDSGGGMVRAVVDGKGTLLSIKIDPSALRDPELLEDLIVSAVGSASRTSQEAMKKEMSTLTGGLNFPGMQELLGGSTS